MESETSKSDKQYKSQEELDNNQELDSYEQSNVVINLNSNSSEYLQPPILSYSYSGISNASSNPELAMHSSRVFEEPSHFTFIKAQKLYTSIQKMVSDAKEVLMFEQDFILYLLEINRWNKDRLYENYYAKADFYMNKNKTLVESKNKLQDLKGICSVCQEEQCLVRNLLCIHAYCIQCWQNYIHEKLNQNTVFFSCMDKCQESPILLHSFVQKYFHEYFEMYRKIVCINYSNTNKSISYCPNKKNNCDLFCQRTQSVFDSSVQCLCGEFYCFFCREEPHYPATCLDVIKWKKLLNNQQGNQEWIERNTKTCPNCKASVQKYIGCSKIKCMCGIQFCYNCNQKWDQIHKQNRGQCTQLIKKSSLHERTGAADFFKVLELSLAISRTEKKSIQMLHTIFQYLKEDWISSKFRATRKEISDAWFALKWGSISSFIYKRAQVDQFIQQQFVQSITKLMESIEKMKSIGNLLFPKELLAIDDEIMNRREILKKNKELWLQAWRSS